MYSHRNMENFPQQLQMQICQYRKHFSQFFVAFPQCTSSLEHFEKRDEPSHLSMPEIIDSKGSGYLNV